MGRHPIRISLSRTIRRPRLRTRFHLFLCPHRRPRRAIRLCPYIQSKYPYKGPSRIWGTTPRCLQVPGSHHTSGKGRGSLYPHHLRLRPHLTRILSSRRPHNNSLPLPMPNNSPIIGTTRRPSYLGRRLCLYCCRLAMVLMPMDNAVNRRLLVPPCRVCDKPSRIILCCVPMYLFTSLYPLSTSLSIFLYSSTTILNKGIYTYHPVP